MIPWPIAFLSMGYALLATSSAAALWRAVQGEAHASLVWQGLGGVLSGILVVGLAMLKPWARKLAIGASVVMMLGALGVAVMAVLQTHPQPLQGLMATGIAGLHLVVMRYLTRPHVKRWFADIQVE